MRYENQVFTADIEIDGHEFVGCEFKNCRLIYKGGSFSFSGSTKFTNANFGLIESAGNTLHFLRLLRAVVPQAFDELMNGGASANQAVPGPSGKPN